MPGKSVQQRMVDVDERIRQFEARKQALAEQIRQKERKERTRRLIQIGAIMASLGLDTVSKAQIFQQVIKDQPEVRTWLDRVLSLSDETPDK